MDWEETSAESNDGIEGIPHDAAICRAWTSKASCPEAIEVWKRKGKGKWRENGPDEMRVCVWGQDRENRTGQCWPRYHLLTSEITDCIIGSSNSCIIWTQLHFCDAIMQCCINQLAQNSKLEPNYLREGIIKPTCSFLTGLTTYHAGFNSAKIYFLDWRTMCMLFYHPD